MAFTRVATYRIQLTPEFDFRAAGEIVPDIAALGVSHLYLSPVAEAVHGSTHGYDVVRPWEVRSELGGADGLLDLARTVRDAGMGLIIDVVPNHVATAEPQRNPWWSDLLSGGRDSDVAEYFDVDWEHGDGKVIVPTLGAPLGEILERGELEVDGDRIRYYDKSFPIAEASSLTAEADAPEDLATILAAQHYRLTHWRNPERNVRRFFTIDDLAAIRPEHQPVAEAIIATAEALAADDLLDGVRVDHIDGLAEPGRYLEDLRRRLGDDCWLLIEKIVVGDEVLPPAWPVQGTTGYEWIRMVDHLFTNPAGETAFAPVAPRSAQRGTYHETELAGVREVLDGELRPDLERLARVAAAELSDGDTGFVDPDSLVGPLVELTAQLGRYRTYLATDLSPTDPHEPDVRPDHDPEVAVLEGAVARARELLDADQQAQLDRVVKAIAGDTEVTRRWQQLSGPALAKGGEDRALYRWLRLGAHNEVGGDPGLWSTSLDDFHEHNTRVAATCPHTLLAGTTHDTKRSEDTRARLLALTEVPELWAEAVTEWTAELESLGAPLGTLDDLALTLGLQTVVAASPIDAGRLGDYLVKASREADLRTSWTDNGPEYEAALRHLAELLTTEPFPGRIAALLERIDPLARSISLAQLTLRLTAPGVPDLYQGSEGWLHTLVDPDNRGLLEVERLRKSVRVSETPGVWHSAHPKAALIRRVLATRADALECFGAGSGYQPIHASGEHGDHVIAFMRTPPRGADHHAVLTVAPRFSGARSAASRNGWGDTRIDLPSGSWRNVLCGDGLHEGATMLADLLGDDPAAVLVNDGADPRR